MKKHKSFYLVALSGVLMCAVSFFFITRNELVWGWVFLILPLLVIVWMIRYFFKRI